ncbi:hypothetical protein, partial [Klebsiella pneumoniae]|uniref:hypothetical protein n=1 Tax=Klebsiella pneumoniae TaxID=573 RepID=UPI001EE8AFB8
LAERRIDRANEADDAVHEPVWKHVTRLMGANVGWSPGAVVGKRLVPILMAVRPTPRIVATALNHFPRMDTPLGVLEVIRS